MALVQELKIAEADSSYYKAQNYTLIKKITKVLMVSQFKFEKRKDGNFVVYITYKLL